MTMLQKLIAIFLVLSSFSACTTVHFQSGSIDLVSLSFENKIVLLSNLEDSQDFDDEGVEDCIRPAMINVNPKLGFVSAKRFRENIYPYFARSTTPHDLEGYNRFLEQVEVRQRIDSLGVRYLIVLTLNGTDTVWHGGIWCGAGYGGGGCIGLSWWDRKSKLGLAIWDLQTKSHAGNLQATAKGTGVMPAFGLPIPLYSPATKSAVCSELGTRLGKLLSGLE